MTYVPHGQEASPFTPYHGKPVVVDHGSDPSAVPMAGPTVPYSAPSTSQPVVVVVGAARFPGPFLTGQLKS